MLILKRLTKKLAATLFNLVLLGALASLLAGLYTEAKENVIYRQLLREEVVGNRLLAGRNKRMDNQYWYYNTKIWESGLNNGKVSILNLEYRVALTELYNLMQQANSIGDNWNKRNPNLSTQDHYIQVIRTLNNDIENDSERALKFRDSAFSDWIFSESFPRATVLTTAGAIFFIVLAGYSLSEKRKVEKLEEKIIEKQEEVDLVKQTLLNKTRGSLVNASQLERMVEKEKEPLLRELRNLKQQRQFILDKLPFWMMLSK